MAFYISDAAISADMRKVGESDGTSVYVMSYRIMTLQKRPENIGFFVMT